MSRKSSNKAEPYYFVGLVLKGTEQQYLNLLKYVQDENGSQVIYQCKSLTYLRVTRDDECKAKVASAEFGMAVEAQGGSAQ
jgi:hypothetical protein